MEVFMNNEKREKLSHSKSLDKYITENVAKLREITFRTMKMYEKQCWIMKRQIHNFKRLKPLSNYVDAYLKWQKELNILEERYEMVFDKYLAEKKELDNISRLY